jgi:hypothetical protein
MKNNTMTGVMFEEIKAQLEAIEKKLDNQGNRQKAPDEERKLRGNRAAIETLMQQVNGYLSAIYSETKEIPWKVQESKKLVLSRLEQIQSAIDNQEKERLARHHHVIGLKSSKVVLAFFMLFFLLFGAIAGNVYQFRRINQMSDNDLKYRYIKIHGGIDQENLANLEDIFHYNRDEKLVKEIRRQVRDFERKVKERAEEMERLQIDEK